MAGNPGPHLLARQTSCFNLAVEFNGALGLVGIHPRVTQTA